MARTRCIRHYYTEEELRALRRARPSDPPTKYEFQVAMERADLATMAEYVALDSVRVEIQATNAYIARRGQEPARVHRPDGDVFPWYWMHRKDSQFHPKTLFKLATWKKRDEVVEWFFAAERAAFMGETLAFVLPQLLQEAANAKWASAVEYLLSSVVFQQYLTPQQQQRALDMALSMSCGRDVVSILVGHGASIQTSKFSGIITPPAVEWIVDHGRTVVGVDFLENERHCIRCHDPQIAAQLLRLGSTFKPSILVRAARMEMPDLVMPLINEGYADVDARSLEGTTALMEAAACCRFERSKSKHEEVICALLQKGADSSLQNATGETGLFRAVASCNVDMAKLLLADLVKRYGAQVVHADELAMGRAWQELGIQAFYKHKTDAKQILVELLKHGACPFVTNTSAQGLAFMKSKEAREIVTSNAALLETCDRCSNHLEERKKKRRLLSSVTP